jgi:hypothetical protein
VAPLGAELAELIRQRFQSTDPEDTNPLAALSDALQDFPDTYPDGWWLDPARCRWWLSLSVDWKAYDEVAWQAQAISRTLGLDTGFVSPAAAEWDEYFESFKRPGSKNSPAAPRPSLSQRLGQVWRALRPAAWKALLRPARQPPSGTPTQDVLGEASDWLRAQGYELLHLGTGGDEYLALPLRRDLLAQAQAICGRLNVSTSLL